MKKFSEIIGYESEKIELMRLCDVIKNKEKYAKLGVEMPKALLIHGEPGLGKTLMATTLIEESGRQCFSCKKDRSDGDFVDKIRETFEKAANNQPSIVFLDDMDKFAQDNLKEDSNKEEFVTIQSCIEDIKDKDVFVVATANDIYNIPYSLLREGRFGKQINIIKPGREDSIKIIKHYLENKPLAPDVSAEFVASLINEKSCAFLKEVINEAGVYAGFENQNIISKKHFVDAIMRISTSNLPSKMTCDKEKETVCFHEAGHAVAAILLGKKPELITCKKHGDVYGFCSTSRNDNFLTYEDIKNDVIITLAGKASTEIIFNTPDLGTSSDLKEAYHKIKNNIELVGTEGIAFVNFSSTYHNKQPNIHNDKVEKKVLQMLDKLFEQTVALLKNNLTLLKQIAKALKEKQVLLWDDICKFL